MKVTKILMFVFVGFAVIFMGCKEGVADLVTGFARADTFRFLYDVESQTFSIVNETQANWNYRYFSSDDEIAVLEGKEYSGKRLFLHNLITLDSTVISNSCLGYLQKPDKRGYAKKMLFLSDYPSHKSNTFDVYDKTIDDILTYTIPLESGSQKEVIDLDWWKDDEHTINIVKETKDTVTEYVYNVFSLSNSNNAELFRDSIRYRQISVNNSGELVLFENTALVGTDSLAKYLSVLSVYDVLEDKMTVIDSIDPNTIVGFWDDDKILYYVNYNEHRIHHKTYSHVSGSVIAEQHYNLLYDYLKFSNNYTKLLHRNTREILILDSRNGEEIHKIEYEDYLENLRKERFPKIRVSAGWYFESFAISPDGKKVLFSFTFHYSP